MKFCPITRLQAIELKLIARSWPRLGETDDPSPATERLEKVTAQAIRFDLVTRAPVRLAAGGSLSRVSDAPSKPLLGMREG